MKKNFIGSGGGKSSPSNTPDDLFSEDVVEFALAISEGPIRGLQKGAQSFYVGTTPLVAADGTTKNFDKFAIGVHPGFPEGVALPLTLQLGGISSTNNVGVTLLTNTPVTRQTDAVLRNSIDELEVRILFSRLLIAPSDGGSRVNTAQFNIEYKTASEPNWHDFYDVHVISVTGKTSGGYIKEFRKKIPRLNEDWLIRVTKISPESTTTDFCDLAWEGFQSTTKGSAVYPDTAITHGIGTANGQFSSLPEFSGVYDGRLIAVPTNYNADLKTYDETTPWNGTFKQAWTDNPAWVLYDLITNIRYGVAAYRPYIDADRYDFYAAAKWCDFRVLGGRARYTFNDVIQDPRPASELLAYVAGSFNGLALDDNNGTIRLLVDKDDPAVMLFSEENIVDNGTGGFDYSYTDITTRANDITVSFINPDLDWNEDRRRIPNITTNEENITLFGRVPLEFVAVGCTNAEEAVRKAAVRLVSSLTEVTMVSFVTTRQGALMNLFDVILIADPTMGWSKSSRVLSHDATFINFRDDIYIEIIKDYHIKVQTLTGIVDVTVRPDSIGAVKQLRLITAYPSNAPKMATFTLEDNTGFGLAKPFRVMSLQEVSDSDGNLYQVTAIEVNRNKYIDADNLLDLPAYQYSFQDPSITPTPTEVTARSGDDHVLLMPSGEVIVRILLSWVRPLKSRITGYEIQWARTDDANWGDIVLVSGEQAYISPVMAGKMYDIRIRSVSALPMGRSPWVTIPGSLVVGKTTPPPDIPSFSVEVRADGTRVFSFDTSNQPPDVKSGGGYRIKHRPAQLGTPWATMTPLHTGLLKTSPYETNTPRDGVYDFGIEAVDSSGNESYNALLFSDFIIGDADFIDAKAGTGTSADAANQLIAELNARIAAHKAEVAQAAVDALIAQVTETASDNVLAMNEKSAIILNYNTVIAEQSGLVAQGVTFGVSSVNYVAKVTALTSYLNALTPAWNDVTQNTPINGPNFRTAFVDVYTVRQLYQNAITVKAKQLADGAAAAAATAQTKADSAFSNAGAAQTSADTANTALGIIADDNKLSKGEKSSVILDYSTLVNEKSILDAQADAFAVSRTAYDTALTTLTTYITGLSPAYNSLTQDTVIDGPTFRTRFSDVYAARQTMLNAISTKAKTLADTAQAAAGTASTAAATAQTKANTAYADAQTSLTKLGVIANDAMLSMGEKPSVYAEWQVLANEYAGIVAQATALAISTTAYAAASSALNTYMAAVHVSNYTVDDAIVRATFNQKFADMYSARQNLLNAITTRANSVADAAAGSASNAQTTANGAKATADAANLALGVIANDNVLSRGEKPAVILEYAVLINEQSGIVTQAASLSVATASYTSAITTLTSYLTGLSPAWNDLASDTAITGTTFRTRFSDVYSAKQVVLNAVAAKSATISTWDGVTGVGKPVLYRIASRGGADVHAYTAAGLYNEAGATISGSYRSYVLTVFRRSDGAIIQNTAYDVYGSTAQAIALAQALNACGADKIIAIYTYDEPQVNRLQVDLVYAMYRCGASPAVYGSPQFQFRSAYLLVAIGGCGMGSGYEAYNGSSYNSNDAWCDAAFYIQRGNLVISGSSSTPKTLADYAYTGDLNATNGATFGTNINGQAQTGDITPGAVTTPIIAPAAVTDVLQVTNSGVPLNGSGSVLASLVYTPPYATPVAVSSTTRGSIGPTVDKHDVSYTLRASAVSSGPSFYTFIVSHQPLMSMTTTLKYLFQLQAGVAVTFTLEGAIPDATGLGFDTTNVFLIEGIKK